MPIGDIFNIVFFAPLVNTLVFILRVLQASSVPGSLGLSIIIVTVLIRFAIWPVMHSQLKSAKKMADLKPHLDQLKKKHGSDKQALAQAQMALYKEQGINPAGGCIPALVQIPIFIALYQVIMALFEGAHGLERINNALYVASWHLSSSPNSSFFGLNLADKPSDFARAGIIVLSIPVITGLLQFIQSKMMYPSPVKQYPSDSPKEKKEKENVEDAMSAVQGQMVYLMPIMIGYFAFTFPVGLAIYWNTFTILGIWQQYKVSGWGGIENIVKGLKLKFKS